MKELKSSEPLVLSLSLVAACKGVGYCELTERWLVVCSGAQHSLFCSPDCSIDLPKPPFPARCHFKFSTKGRQKRPCNSMRMTLRSPMGLPIGPSSNPKTWNRECQLRQGIIHSPSSSTRPGGIRGISPGNYHPGRVGTRTTGGVRFFFCMRALLESGPPRWLLFPLLVPRPFPAAIGRWAWLLCP